MVAAVISVSQTGVLMVSTVPVLSCFTLCIADTVSVPRGVLITVLPVSYMCVPLSIWLAVSVLRSPQVVVSEVGVPLSGLTCRVQEGYL